MKYFCAETERKKSKSSCYLEFQKGRYANKCWLEDSICLHDDIFEKLGLYQVLISAIPQFDHWGITEVSPEQWQLVKSNAEMIGGEVLIAVIELDEWVVKCFEKEEVFTICGI